MRARPALAAAILLAVGPPASAAIEVAGGWVRAAPPGAPTAAAYLTLINTGKQPDRLLGGSTPAAASLGLHSMSVSGGVMRMRALDQGLALPPGARVVLAPGGDHLMLAGLRRPLQPGQRVRLALRFQTSGVVAATLPVFYREPGRGP